MIKYCMCLLLTILCTSCNYRQEYEVIENNLDKMRDVQNILSKIVEQHNLVGVKLYFHDKDMTYGIRAYTDSSKIYFNYGSQDSKQLLHVDSTDSALLLKMTKWWFNNAHILYYEYYDYSIWNPSIFEHLNLKSSLENNYSMTIIREDYHENIRFIDAIDYIRKYGFYLNE